MVITLQVEGGFCEISSRKLKVQDVKSLAQVFSIVVDYDYFLKSAYFGGFQLFIKPLSTLLVPEIEMSVVDYRSLSFIHHRWLVFD